MRIAPGFLTFSLYVFGVLATTSLVKSDDRAKEDAAYLASIDTRFKNTPFNIVKRKQIFHELCLAESRAQWESERLYTLDQDAQRTAYQEKQTPIYEAAVRKKYGLKSADDFRAIVGEAFPRKWSTPKYPGFDVVAASKPLKVTVYANKGDLTYHREGCFKLEDNGPIISLSLHKALSQVRSHACGICQP